MIKNGLGKLIQVRERGDLLSIFKPVDETLSSSKARIYIPLNLFNRKGREIKYSILELIVESKELPAEWKLKLEDISITRHFKPTYSLELSNEGLYIYKFVYDITSILNIPEIMSKEWINLNIKYIGGPPFTVKALLIDAVYGDQDASITYEHVSGLNAIPQGNSLQYEIGQIDEKPQYVRLIFYSPRRSSIVISFRDKKSTLQMEQKSTEEYMVGIDGSGHLELIPQFIEGRTSPLVLSSITTYGTCIRQPIIELCNFGYERTTKNLSLRLDICNKGHASPDKMLITLMKSGMSLASIQDLDINLPPGGVLRKEISLPMSVTGEEIRARLIWFKSTRRWIKDEVLRLG